MRCSVCAAVRSVEVDRTECLDLVEVTGVAPEVSAGGGGGANWVALRTSSGVTKPIHGATIGANVGGVGRQIPGPVAG